MRYIDRRSVTRPFVLESSQAEDFRADVRRYLQAGDRGERPPKPPSFITGDPGVREYLGRLFGNACAYCETPLRDAGYVDFFRPQQGAEGQDGSVHFQHYCWIAAEWDNLYLACANCLREKRNRFPAEPRGPVGASPQELRQLEGNTLLDPCYDNPAEHFGLDPDADLVPRSRRAAMTIDILDLNRPDLVMARRETVDRVLSRDLSLDERARALLPGSPFSGIAWLALLETLPSRPTARRQHRLPRGLSALRRLVAGAIGDGGGQPGHGGNRLEQDGERRRYVRRVTVRNFRGLPEATLDFPEMGRESSKAAGSVVILGENGTGKTSLLQATAVGVLGPWKAAEIGLTPESCLTDGELDGEVLIEFWGTDRTNRVTFEARAPEFGGHLEVPVMVLGYGAHRLSARGEVGHEGKHYEYRVRSLFDERALVNGALGLRKHLRTAGGQPDDDRLEDATRTINAVLQGRAKARLGSDKRLFVDERGRPQRLDQLSSGYKSIVALTADIMDVMYEVWKGMTSGLALVLVDEIDAHLHPSWRLAIVEAMRQTFPSAQFLMTTHDPLPLRGLGEGEVAVLHREQGRVTVERPRARGLDGMTVDQMLTSDLFGLSSTLDPATADQLKRYYSLLTTSDTSPPAVDALKAAEAALPPQIPLGDDPRERLLYKIIDRYLARSGSARADNLSEQTIDELVDAFDVAQRDLLAQDAEKTP